MLSSIPYPYQDHHCENHRFSDTHLQMQKLKEAHEGRDWCALPGESGEDPGLGASLGMLWAMPQCCFVSPL